MEDKMLLAKVLHVLNEAVELDSEAINMLFSHYVGVNQKLSDHPTIQVKDYGEKPSVGPLGLINGIVESMTGDRVAAVYDDTGKIIRFQEYTKP